MKLAAVGFMAVGLSACGGFQLQDAKMMSMPADPFANALYKEYIELSGLEYNEGDYADSDAFAMRAMASANGEPPSPESINARPLPAGTEGDLKAARSQLVVAMLTGKSATKWPELTARAQAMFDCWMQEQEENIQPEDIKRCRSGFEDAMVQIRAKMIPSPMPAPAPAPAPMPMAKEMPGPFTIFFDFNSSAVTSTGQGVVGKIAAAYASSKPGRVILKAHTDRAGSGQYNAALSRKRADAAKAALAKAGIPASAIGAAFFGENQPAAKTPDGARSQSNRRVEVTFQ